MIWPWHKRTWMDCAMALKTSSRNCGGVIDWMVAKSMVLESLGYPDGSILSNLMLNSVPARDCVLNCEEGTPRPEKRAH